MAGIGGHKPETKKRAAQGTVEDEYAEKRFKSNCWERSEDEEVEAIRARRRARSVEFQNFMAAADRVDKAARDFLEHRISLRAASKTDATSPC